MIAKASYAPHRRSAESHTSFTWLLVIFAERDTLAWQYASFMLGPFNIYERQINTRNARLLVTIIREDTRKRTNHNLPTNLNKPNTTDLERDLQRPTLKRSTIDQRRRTWAPSAGRLGCFFFLFFSFLRSSNVNSFRFAFLDLNAARQAFTRTISIWSAKSNHALRCSLSGELATGRACLRTGEQVAAS